MNNETRNEHFIYTKQLVSRVRDREISIDKAVNELYEFTFNMAYSKEHNPNSDEKIGGGAWGGNGTPNYVFVLNIIEDTMSSVHHQYSNTNFYNKFRFAKKSTKIALNICSMLFSYVDQEVKDTR